jgi:phosphotransferase system HPr (HPr) family protein
MPTIERQVTIDNLLGIHVRPAAQLAAAAQRFQSDILIQRDRETFNAKSSLELLTMAAVQGTVLVIRARGDDAEAAVEAVAHLITSRFGEDR